MIPLWRGRYTTGLYFEAHITIDPVTDVQLERFKFICAKYDFRVAELLMKKGPSTIDSFCTGRGKNYKNLRKKTEELVTELRNHFKVRRYKIENTLLDLRFT